MPLTFAVSLFFVAGLGELVRQGGLEVQPLSALLLIGAAMGLAALALLGRDVPGLIRHGRAARYGTDLGRWSWRRTLWLLCIVPFMWLTAALFGAVFSSYVVLVPKLPSLLSAFAVQCIVVALAQELFFREGVLKVFGRHLPTAYAITAVATLLFYLPQGGPAAVMAAGCGLAYMALRVSGMNILAVAMVHGATSVLFGRVVVAQLDNEALWPFAFAYAGGHALFAIGLTLALRQGNTLLAQQAG